ncbi:MAG: HDIG domain-containing metalloprotein [Christensenellales bacterium]|jgi:putative nucleotidyltransferase with HDIG domain
MNKRIKSSKEIADIKADKLFLTKNFGRLAAMAFIASCAVNLITYLAFKATLRYSPSDYVKYTLIYMGILIFLLLPSIYYISRNLHRFSNIERDFSIILTTFGITLGLCILSAYMVGAYIMPVVLIAMLIAVTVDKKTAALISTMTGLAVFSYYLLVLKDKVLLESVASLLSATVAGLMFCILFEQSHTRWRFALNGLYIAGISGAICALSAMFDGFEVRGILIAAFSGIASIFISMGFFWVLLPIYEGIFKISTKFLLAELCSLEAPLMKRLMNEAPGTYAHSLMVGNIAESCAMVIGESPMLARAGGYYHDIGKLKKPNFFTENQIDGVNPHDEFIPEVSLRLILDHVKNGRELAAQYKLPSELIDIITQHHGTTAVNYFYYKVQNITEKLLRDDAFRYDGPRPQSKIAAIIMLVDTVEAALRTKVCNSDEERREYIHSLIKEKIDKGQFGECNITLKDLQLIEDTLVEIIPSQQHTRVEYKKAKTNNA